LQQENITAPFETIDLKKEGYLRRNSPHGLWEISDEGREQLAEWLGMIKKVK